MLSGIGAALLGLGGTAAAIGIHDFFEGETLIRDVADELALSRMSLAQLDARWAANPRRTPAVVSLTSIPSRLPLIGRTLKSLLRQSLAPERIVLNLPRFSKREAVDYEAPAFLEGLAGVHIRWCEDAGPATKLLPTLAAEAPQTPVIVVDDDRIYPANLVAGLVAAAERQPDAAFCMSGWVVPADLIDRPTTLWSNLNMLPPAPVRARRLRQPVEVDIVQGLSGYLVRPAFFDLTAVTDYSQAPPEAFFVDDVWISAHCRARRFVIPSRRANYQPKLHRGFYGRTSLGRINRGPGPDAQRNNSIVIRHFAQAWMTSAAGAA
ncbi:MAG: glycosyltransferase family 2 protein [Aestuariivirga sp.]|uniref:glycosyltransferase family A protein n=1 Tax=Aestuariivirga sp. TaxID=2650926 RepID=UPI0025B87075|nr:glycosyltransferase family A protein [Aestuariivirga sp.]MCA3561682.1 glycosyltransferase family 2 protein [Aestuariivirga sp.]